jgi:hypothetical protein
MYILKYKHGDETFYRVTESRQPAKQSILFDRPSASPISAKMVSNSLSKIEEAFNEPSEKEKEKKKKASLVLQKFTSRLNEG